MTDSLYLDVLADRDRLRALSEYPLHDPGLRRELGDICRRTAQDLGTAMSAVNVVLDSAVLTVAAHHGDSTLTEGRLGSPAPWAVCSFVVVTNQPVVVPDMADDPRFAGTPPVTLAGLRSYAGVPLVCAGGQVLGAHCAMDTDPAEYSPADLATLREAADEVLRVLEVHRRRTVAQSVS